MRAVVAQAVDMTNQLLALLYKLGTGQDPKQTAQVRGCGRGESGVQPPRRRHSWGALAQPLVLTCVSWPPQACAALYLVSKVGSWFSFITLSYMGAPPSLRGCTSMARSAECNAHLLPCRLGAQLTLICGALAPSTRPATVLFFAMPKLYEKNQTEADKLLALASQQMNVLLEKLPKVQKIAKSD